MTGYAPGVTTLKAKLDVDVPDEVILGACRPELAHRALTADPSVATLLPCNVVVRAAAPGRTVVEAVDPATVLGVTGRDDLAGVAGEARRRLTGALSQLTAVARRG